METGVRRSTGARHYYAGRLGERAHAGRRAPDETRARLERGRGDEREINREREERSLEPSHGVVAARGGDSGGGVAVVLRWSVCLVDDDGRSSLRVRSATGFGSLL